MGGTTNSQALRFPYVDEVIGNASIQNAATDIATKLDVQDVNRKLITARPIASVRRNAAQNIAINTDTLIIWDTVALDPGSYVNLGTQPTRITVPAAATGLWRVNIGGFNIGGAAWTRTQVSILVTGVLQASKTYFGQDYNYLSYSDLVNVPNANDYIEMRIRHAGGATDPISPLSMTATLQAKT